MIAPIFVHQNVDDRQAECWEKRMTHQDGDIEFFKGNI
jgi:hypothetical protein